MGFFLKRYVVAAAIGATGLSFCLLPGETRAQAQPQSYATFGDWQVEFVPADPRRRAAAHCRVTKIFAQENALRVVSGEKLFALDYMGMASAAHGPNYEVSYWFDKFDPQTNRSAVAQANDEDGDWMRIQESTDEPGSEDGLMNGQRLSIKMNSGPDQWQYPLAGSKPALSSLFECRDTRVAQLAPPVAQVRPAPPPVAPPLVVQAAPRPPAPGKSFYVNTEGADVPSLCIDIAGGRIQEGTPIMLWQCHQQSPQRFGLNPRAGLVFATANNRLCVDGFDKQQLLLVRCDQVATQWRYDPRSNTIRSANGLCWDVFTGNVPANIRQRQKVVAWRCHNGINQQFVLND